MLLPATAGFCFIIYEPRTKDIPIMDDEGFSEKLPTFPFATRKEKIIAICLIAFPLFCRGPVISTQIGWIGLQNEELAIPMQTAIACGIIVAAIIISLIVQRVWNNSFILVYELFVQPLMFIAFQTAQMFSDLWSIYMLIIDSTYKITLFYIFMVPFLFPNRPQSGKSATPLLWSFAVLIGGRALFVALGNIEPNAVYAGITVVVVLVTFVGACIVSFAFLQQQANRQRTADTFITREQLKSELGNCCSVLENQYKLTPRETEIVTLLAQNYRAPYIAEKLVLSLSTVKTHMRNIYAKLNVHSQAELLILLDTISEQSQK